MEDVFDDEMIWFYPEPATELEDPAESLGAVQRQFKQLRLAALLDKAFVEPLAPDEAKVGVKKSN